MAAKLSGTGNWDKLAPGLPGQLSPEQQDVLDRFMKRAAPADVDCMRFPREPPEYLGCRCLRARKFDLEEALKLLSVTVAWRRSPAIASLASKTPYDLLGCLEDEILAHYPKTYFPVPDKNDRPVYIEGTGHVDVDAMFVITDMDRLLAYHTWTYETGTNRKLIEASEKAGRPITALTSILDLADASFSMTGAATRTYVQRASAIDSAYYPETMGKLFIINAPGFFSAFWALIKGFFDERTTRKIEICSGPSTWMPRMVDVIGKDRLPTQYGGSLVVEHIFKHSRTATTVLPTGRIMRDVLVLPASTRSGLSVRFKWYTKPGDIKFSVHFFPGPCPAALQAVGKGGVTQPEPPRFCHPPVESVPAAEMAALAPLASAAVEVAALSDHPTSDKQPVVVTHALPASGGFYIATYNNLSGWRQREVCHRWDIVVDGRPVEDPMPYLLGTAPSG